MTNTATKIADLLTRHDVDLMRVEAGLRRKIIGLLRGLEQDVVSKLQRSNPSAPAHTSFKLRRLDVLMAATKDSYNKVYGTVGKTLKEQLVDLAEAESVNTVNTVNKVLQVNVMDASLDKRTLKALVDGALIEGAPSKHWWAEQKRSQRTAFERAMREGVIAGEPLGTLVQRVRGTRAAQFKNGIFSTTRRQAEALVRSSVQAVANETRNKTYAENSDVVKGKQWLSTLDTRTSDICKALDGQAWDLEGKRLSGTTHDFVQPPPAHWNCRSTLVPVLKSWDELSGTKSSKIRGILKSKKPGRRTRSEMDGKKVSNTISYEKWLRNKDRRNPEMVVDILGPTKYKLWKEGKLSFRDLIDQSWNPLTVAELRDKVGLKVVKSKPKPKPKPTIVKNKASSEPSYVYSDITEDEWVDWAHYSTDINEALKGTLKIGDISSQGEKITKKMLREFKIIGAKINSVAGKTFMKNKTEFGKFYRGESYDSLETIERKYKFRASVKYDGLTSITDSADIAGMYANAGMFTTHRVVLTFETPSRGVRGVQTAPFGTPSAEAIMPTDSKWRVSSKPVTIKTIDGSITRVSLYSTEKIPKGLTVKDMKEGLK